MSRIETPHLNSAFLCLSFLAIPQLSSQIYLKLPTGFFRFQLESLRRYIRIYRGNLVAAFLRILGCTNSTILRMPKFTPLFKSCSEGAKEPENRFYRSLSPAKKWQVVHRMSRSTTEDFLQRFLITDRMPKFTPLRMPKFTPLRMPKFTPRILSNY
jgi:hypothetical protein